LIWTIWQFERRTYDGLSAYAQSKACDRMLTWALARKLHGQQVTVTPWPPASCSAPSSTAA
jgi:NAD(P)-dependent dehydrogenase (short-subunit alcohol dehydrogenase family)